MSESILYKVGANLITTLQFKDVGELDLPKSISKKRLRKITELISSHNESLKEQARLIKKYIDNQNNTNY